MMQGCPHPTQSDSPGGQAADPTNRTETQCQRETVHWPTVLFYKLDRDNVTSCIVV